MAGSGDGHLGIMHERSHLDITGLPVCLNAAQSNTIRSVLILFFRFSTQAITNKEWYTVRFLAESAKQTKPHDEFVFSVIHTHTADTLTLEEDVSHSWQIQP